MINRTKIASLAVCAILSAAVLTGCGGSSASSSTASSAAPAASSQAASSVVSSAAAGENGASDLDGIYNALLQADPISNQFEIAAMNIEYDFGLQAEDVVSYKGVKSNDNGDAGLVLVIEAADGKAEDIAQYLTKGNGGVVNSSRGILLAYKKQPGTAFDEAAYNECVNMKEAIAHACSLL